MAAALGDRGALISRLDALAKTKSMAFAFSRRRADDPTLSHESGRETIARQTRTTAGGVAQGPAEKFDARADPRTYGGHGQGSCSRKQMISSAQLR